MWMPALLGAGWFVFDVGQHFADRSASTFQPLIRGLAVPVALLAWALASASWSTAPELTPKQVVLAGMVIASAAWFGLSLEFRQQVAALFLATHVLTLGSLVAVIVTPSARFSAYITDRSWIGLFGNPNLLAPVATAAVLTIVGAWPLIDRRWRGILVVLCTIDLVVAAKAMSVTAWLALCVGCAAIVIATLVRRHDLGNESTRRAVVVGFGAAVLASVTVAASLPVLARAAGKDADLRRAARDLALCAQRPRGALVQAGSGSAPSGTTPSTKLDT